MGRSPKRVVLAEVRAYRRGLWDGMRLYAELRQEPTTATENVALRALWDSIQVGTFDDEERARKRRTGEK